MRNSSSSTSLGDLAIYALFLALSVVAGGLVVTLLLVATSPLVAIFPPGSGASEIVLGIALLWGVVTGCVVAVFTLGPWRRLRARAQIEAFDDSDAVPLELIGRKLPPRRIANDARPRRAAVAYRRYEAEDQDEALLEDEPELPRRVPAGQRYRRAS